MLKKLDDMAAYSELHTCRRKYLLNYFDEEAADNCGSCDICLSEFKKFDGTLIAQKALSAVARLNQRFGITYVIDFLRGSKSEKIWADHKSLKTYGIGADISKADWQHHIRELVTMCYLQTAGDEYPVLKLTAQSTDVLKGGQKVEFIEIEKVEEVHHEENLPFEAALLNQLKEVRRGIATNENVPAYIIVSDATLQEMATYLPQSLDELRLISGFGDVKLARYGRELLQPVKDYCAEKGLGSKIKHKSPKRERKAKSERSASPRTGRDTKGETFDLFRSGKAIKDIAIQRGLSINTIENHLSHYIQTGEVEISELVPEEKIPVIADAIETYGGEKLSPLKEVLGDDYSYGEIKAVIGWMNREE
jgi:ATP-dependent DNA helicase RecQ